MANQDSHQPSKLRLEPKNRLLLKNRLLSNRVTTLFRELEHNETLQKAFIDSPMEVLGQEVLHLEYTPEQASAANHFIFSVLASKELQQWSQTYDKENAHRQLTTEQRLEDLSRAFIQHGDPAVMKGLLGLVETGTTLPGLTQAALIVKAESVAIGNWFVYKVAGRVVGADDIVLPAAQVQKLAEQLLERAQQLRTAGQI